MKKVLSALTLCFLTSFFANAITLDAYLKNHKDIEEDPILSEYVRKWAWFMALMDSQQKYNTSDSTKINELLREGANKQVISSQADSLIKISRIWADFFPANTSNQPI
ncbi:hypothetical protein JY494_07440 [Serratia marcescens]|nr:hypothetical protein [Serratia marcescens]